VGFLVQITFINSKKIGSGICLIKLANIWWIAIDQHRAIEIWQILKHNSTFFKECLHIAGDCAKLPINNINTFVNGLMILELVSNVIILHIT
jgi:hypothetical protein